MPHFVPWSKASRAARLFETWYGISMDKWDKSAISLLVEHLWA